MAFRDLLSENPHNLHCNDLTLTGNLNMSGDTVTVGSITSSGVVSINTGGGLTDYTSGALRVIGGASIQDGFSSVDFSDFHGDVNLYSTTQSISTSTGALQVVGGVGIAGNLNVGGDVISGNIYETSVIMEFGGVNTISNTLYITKVNNRVFLSWAHTTAESPSATIYTSTSSLAEAFRPVSQNYIPCVIMDNDAFAPGIVSVGTDGSITVGTSSYGNFTASGHAGFSIQVSYDVQS
jgi:hypothetical protein